MLLFHNTWTTLQTPPSSFSSNTGSVEPGERRSVARCLFILNLNRVFNSNTTVTANTVAITNSKSNRLLISLFRDCVSKANVVFSILKVCPGWKDYRLIWNIPLFPSRFSSKQRRVVFFLNNKCWPSFLKNFIRFRAEFLYSNKLTSPSTPVSLAHPDPCDKLLMKYRNQLCKLRTFGNGVEAANIPPSWKKDASLLSRCAWRYINIPGNSFNHLAHITIACSGSSSENTFNSSWQYGNFKPRFLNPRSDLIG